MGYEAQHVARGKPLSKGMVSAAIPMAIGMILDPGVEWWKLRNGSHKLVRPIQRGNREQLVNYGGTFRRRATDNHHYGRGHRSPGNPYAGPFLAPLPILETAQPFIPITRACSIVDAVCFVTASGAATAQPHYLLVCKNSIQNVIGYLTSGLLQPNSAQRHALALKFKPGDTCFFKSVTGSAVVEAVTGNSSSPRLRFVPITVPEALERIRTAAHVHNRPDLAEAATVLELVIKGSTATEGTRRREENGGVQGGDVSK